MRRLRSLALPLIYGRAHLSRNPLDYDGRFMSALSSRAFRSNASRK